MEKPTKVVLVTGSTYGIGRATVQCFAQHGDAGVMADQDIDRGKSLETSLQNAGRLASLYQPK